MPRPAHTRWVMAAIWPGGAGADRILQTCAFGNPRLQVTRAQEPRIGRQCARCSGRGLITQRDEDRSTYGEQISLPTRRGLQLLRPCGENAQIIRFCASLATSCDRPDSGTGALRFADCP
jgi:hypothetical protein